MARQSHHHVTASADLKLLYNNMEALHCVCLYHKHLECYICPSHAALWRFSEALCLLQLEDPSLLSNVSRGSAASLGSIQSELSGEAAGLPALMRNNDWEIPPMDIEILRREDGSAWELGAGAFGKVGPDRSPILCWRVLH